MSKYQPETPFQITPDNTLVYCLHTTGYRWGEPLMANEVSLSISARTLTDAQRREIAETVRDALNQRFPAKLEETQP